MILLDTDVFSEAIKPEPNPSGHARLDRIDGLMDQLPGRIRGRF